MPESPPLAMNEEMVALMFERSNCGLALLNESRFLYANATWLSAEASDPLVRWVRAYCEGGKIEARAEEAEALLTGLAEALENERAAFEMGYAHNGGTYLLRVNPLRIGGRNLAAVQRTELTAQLVRHHQIWEERRLVVERERQIQELLALEKLSAGEMSAETAEIYGRMSLRESQPEIFQSLMERYGEMLSQMADGRIYQITYDISDRLRAMGDQLGLVHAGSRDVIDLHTNALRKAMVDADTRVSSALLEEGGRMALELMSYLVAHYRKYLWLNQNQTDLGAEI